MLDTETGSTFSLVPVVASSGSTAPVRQAALVAPLPTVGAGGAGVVKNAMAYLGSAYVFGGTSPGGFDCSGFVWYVHKISGIAISRGIWGQLNGGPRITMANLVPGDTVFFANTYMPGLSHVGIYIGGGRFIHAVDESRGVGINGPRRGVLVEPLYRGGAPLLGAGRSAAQAAAQLHEAEQVVAAEQADHRSLGADR